MAPVLLSLAEFQSLQWYTYSMWRLNRRDSTAYLDNPIGGFGVRTMFVSKLLLGHQSLLAYLPQMLSWEVSQALHTASGSIGKST